MRAAERGVHEVADIGVARVHVDPVAVLDRAPDLVDVGEVDHRVDALGVQVQGERHEVDVAGALAVAEEAPLDALGAGEQRQLRAGDPRAAVVVRMHGKDHPLAALQIAMHVLDLIGVDVGRRDLHRGGQVQDHRALRRRLPERGHRIADLERVVGLGEHEHLGRELEAHARQICGEGAHIAPRVQDQFAQLIAVAAEHGLPPDRRRRGVQVDHDGVADAADRLDRPGDEIAPCGGEHDDRHVLGGDALLDDQPDEVEVGLRGGGIADLDLLVAHRDHEIEEAPLARGIHGFRECLVAVAEIDGDPQRCGREASCRPGPLGIGEGDRDPVVGVGVAVGRHLRMPLAIPPRGVGGERAGRRGDAGEGGAGHGSLFLRLRFGDRRGASATTEEPVRSGPVVAAKKKEGAHEHGGSVALTPQTS